MNRKLILSFKRLSIAMAMAMAMAIAMAISPSLLHRRPLSLLHDARISKLSLGANNCAISRRCIPRLGFTLHARTARGVQSALNGKPRLLTVTCKATVDQASPNAGSEVYQGAYGAWSVDASDIREVILYRAGLVTTAAAFCTAASAAFLPTDSSIKSTLLSSCDLFYAAGASGLGLSLFLVHIYVTPLKRALQFLWAVGVLGSVGVYLNFSAPANQGLVEYVLDHPMFIWAVGPLFASLTGLVFKEGLCYGKLEAAALFFVIPSLLLGHLAGVLDQNSELAILALWMGLFGIFAARKFTQPIKDDIGDKSIFVFNALPDEAKRALLLRIQERSVKEPLNF